MKWARLTPAQRNALVAERVTGWTDVTPCDGHFEPLVPATDGLSCKRCGVEIGWGDLWKHGRPRTPAYSEDVGAALQLVKCFERVAIERHTQRSGLILYEVEIFPDPKPIPPWDALGRPLPRRSCWGVARTLPEAICRAALRAVGVEIE